ncbi:MAG: fluoride efflux transporter CrcB [Candidatus Omnitrophica bacterium]|nr:fluoride efflux transporter CrcB [Candidatus Omnitrophota bacterium]
MNYVWVALGGALGSVLRYMVVNFSGRTFLTDFPVGTLLVNVIGCFVIACIGALGADKLDFNHQLRLFLFTGILGGFTTFSAFGYETFFLLRTSHYTLAFANVCANVVLGLGAAIFGYVCGRQWPG